MCGEYCKYWARSVEANTSKQRASRALARRPRNSSIITQHGKIPSRLQCDSICSCILITSHESLNHDQRDAGDASQFELIVTEETERRKERGNESDTLSRDALRVPGRCETDLGNRNMFYTILTHFTPGIRISTQNLHSCNTWRAIKQSLYVFRIFSCFKILISMGWGHQ